MVFYENSLKIASLNAENTGVIYGETQFMDMTHEEFVETQLGYKPYLRNTPLNYKVLNANEIPNDVDWRSKGAVTDVKD